MVTGEETDILNIIKLGLGTDVGFDSRSVLNFHVGLHDRGLGDLLTINYLYMNYYYTVGPDCESP